jgi:hypothetical protein
VEQSANDPIRIASDVVIQMAFACENISTDPLHRVTFHNLVEQLNAPQFPVQTPMLYAVFGFQRTVPGFLLQNRVEITPPVGDSVAAQSLGDLAFRPDQINQRAILGFQGIVWPEAGEYTVRFTSRGATIASFVLRLALVAPQRP